jgi:hypothetical protein
MMELNIYIVLFLNELYFIVRFQKNSMDGLPSHEEWFGIHITHKNGLKKKKISNENLSICFQYVHNKI